MPESSENSRVFGQTAELMRPLLGADDFKNAAAPYIGGSEKFAALMIESQEKAGQWAKAAPLGSWLRAQCSIKLMLLESRAKGARNLWRLSSPDQ